MADKVDYPKTRKEAMELGLPYYFTGNPCGRGHVAPRKTKGACTECMREDSKKANETRKEYFQKYNESERGKEAKRRYYEENKDIIAHKARTRDPEDKRRYRKKYKDENKELYRVLTNERRRRHREATPSWLSPEQKQEIREKYKLAAAMTKETGVLYSVDHIVPLKGETVCGLHVPWNLRVLTHIDNSRKSNKLENEDAA